MKSLFLILLTLALPTLRAAEVTIRITNPPLEGAINLLVFDSANAFGDFRDPIKTASFPATPEGVYTITNLPTGELAVAAYHDENGNQQLDENFMGIPSEPLGLSNGYRPKGPPSYVKAAFDLEETGATFDMELRRPLGKRGQIAVGAGILGRSSPYRNYDGSVYQFIPAITYIGERVQIFGPALQIGLYRHGSINLAARGTYAIGVYEEEDSPFLEGMGDRESTFMSGLAIQNEFPGGFQGQLSYEHDVLDRIGGGTAKIQLSKSFQYGIFRFSPQLGATWLSASLGDHYFGVPEAQATGDRPAYTVDDSTSFELGLGSFIETSKHTRIILNITNELLDSEVTDSPIVSEDYVIKGFGAFSYAF